MLPIVKSITTIPTTLCKQLTHLFTDIDDTMTSDGLLLRESFDAMWRLSNHGIRVVPVTGRPAGWCDHIARMWPVEAVIGENGAFYFAYDRTARRMNRRYLLSKEAREAGEERMERARRRVLAEVPNAAISADQPFRFADLAIDFCEDVEPLERREIDAICRILDEEGLTYKVSSIHINTWYGDHNKVACLKQYLSDRGATTEAPSLSEVVFLGDSPNDEPIFAEVEHGIGVANIRTFEDRLTHPPAYVTERESGLGFAEAVDTILAKRTAG